MWTLFGTETKWCCLCMLPSSGDTRATEAEAAAVTPEAPGGPVVLFGVDMLDLSRIGNANLRHIGLCEHMQSCNAVAPQE